MRGETVYVIRTETEGGMVDPFGAPVPSETTRVPVENVLVAPGPRSDLQDRDRPDADRVVYNLHFPKTFTGDLRNTRVEVRGEVFAVIGAPKPYQLANTPTRWWMPVEVEDIRG